MGNATRMGMMGAITGGLQFLMSDFVRRQTEEAELVKLQRLRALDVEKEGRANAEWTRRQQVETQDAMRMEEIKALRDERIKRGEYDFRAGEADKERAHDVTMEDRRTANDIAQAERESHNRRREHVYEKTFDTVLDSKMPKSDKGQYGKSGKFYPLGTDIPADDQIVSGAGVTFAPSESKSAAPGGRRPGRSAAPAAAAVAQPGSSQANPKQVYSVEEAESLPPGTWIRLPNGKVGQR